MSARDVVLAGVVEQLRRALEAAEVASKNDQIGGGYAYAYGYLGQAVRDAVRQIEDTTKRPTRRRKAA